MQIGMIGLGRMGANMVRRLLDRGSSVCGLRQVAESGAGVGRGKGRWLVLPRRLCEEAHETAGGLVDGSGGGRGQNHRRSPALILNADDILIDGGNSYYMDDIRRAKELAPKGIHYVDVGTSGGVWGLERGYCMMIGGENAVVKHLDPIFARLAPGMGKTYRARPGVRRLAVQPSRVICIAAQTAPATSSRWSITESSTASWPPTPRDWVFCDPPTSASRNTKSTPRQRRCATPSTINTISIYPTSRRYGGAAA